MGESIDDAIEERRFWRRFQFTLPVRVAIRKCGDISLIDGRGYELNAGGFALFANGELAIGDEAEIAFMQPSFDPPLTLRGVVRNHAAKHYGIKFLATSAAEADQLDIFRQILGKIGSVDA